MRRIITSIFLTVVALSFVAGDCIGGKLIAEHGGGGSAGAVADAGGE